LKCRGGCCEGAEGWWSWSNAIRPAGPGMERRERPAWSAEGSDGCAANWLPSESESSSSWDGELRVCGSDGRATDWPPSSSESSSSSDGELRKTCAAACSDATQRHRSGVGGDECGEGEGGRKPGTMARANATRMAGAIRAAATKGAADLMRRALHELPATLVERIRPGAFPWASPPGVETTPCHREPPSTPLPQGQRPLPALPPLASACHRSPFRLTQVSLSAYKKKQWFPFLLYEKTNISHVSDAGLPDVRDAGLPFTHAGLPFTRCMSTHTGPGPVRSMRRSHVSI